MQEVSEREFVEIAGKFSQDFAFKLRLAEEEDGERLKSEEEVELTSSPREAEAGSVEEEFSFSCSFAGGSPISADDIFQDGRILPVYPLFNRDLLFTGDESGRQGALVPPLRKVFVEEEEEEDSSDEAAGPYCEWKGKRPPAAVVDVSSSEVCKKSNSTGFSKLRRFRELVLRSNSDGNDAFVFLNPNNNNNDNNNNNNNDNNGARKTEEKTEDKNKRKTKKGKETTPYLVHYARNRAAKEGNKRTSYLPYRVGFFASANGFSRNVHPF